jgi:hypothetical protein
MDMQLKFATERRRETVWRKREMRSVGLGEYTQMMVVNKVTTQ